MLKPSEPDTFVVAFRGPEYLPDTWRVCGEHPDQPAAEKDLAELVATDVAEGAPTGCEWRLHRERGSFAHSIKHIHMTAAGPVEQPVS